MKKIRPNIKLLKNTLPGYINYEEKKVTYVATKV